MIRKRKHTVKLGTKMLAVVALSGALSISVFLIIRSYAWEVLTFAIDLQLIEDPNKEILEKLQEDIKESEINIISHKESKKTGVSSSQEDIDKLTDILKSYIDIADIAIYDENGYYVLSLPISESGVDFYYENSLSYVITDTYPGWISRLYDIEINGKTCSVVIRAYEPSTSYIDIYAIFNIGIPIFIFLLLILLYVRFKMHYIVELNQEITSLENGDLEHSIRVKSNDEISELARQLNQLRIALKDNMESEQIAYRANKDLITAISHDLRTPLTSLMGYLDIISLEKYTSEEQLHRYVTLSKEKAVQIKELSDRLFQYFLVYDSNKEILLEPIECSDIITIIESHEEELERSDFHFHNQFNIEAIKIMANHSVLQRIMDNLFSNVSKYADPKEVVDVTCTTDKGMFVITIVNKKNKVKGDVESNQIGLRSTSKMMSQNHGTLKIFNEFGIFEVELKFPVITPKETDKSE